MRYGYGIAARAAGGLTGGVLAGIVMALTAMIRVATLGLGFWLPMKLVAGIVWGVEALIGGIGALVVGILIHLAVAGTGGMLFGVFFGRRLNAATALLLGLPWAAAIWVLNTWAILPWLNPVMLQRQMVAPMWWFGYHMVYGAMLFSVPLFIGVFGRRRSIRAAPEPD